METIVTVERGDVNKGATWNVAGKIGKTGKICAFCSATQKNDEILLVSGVCRETFVGVRRLKTVRIRVRLRRLSTKRDFSFFIVERRRAI